MILVSCDVVYSSKEDCVLLKHVEGINGRMESSNITHPTLQFIKAAAFS